jgi:hypothetical protein
MSENRHTDRLMLPAPSAEADGASAPTTQLNIEGSSLSLDALGPMVVNSDGVSASSYHLGFSMLFTVH